MKLLVFLGNPWPHYHTTKHNIGFLIGDLLATYRNCPQRSLDKSSKSHITSTSYQGEKLILCKPQTFMNLSWQSVVTLQKYYHLDLKQIAIIHDDIDLAPWIVRRKFGGSSGGQNGVKHIIQQLGSDQFGRVKIGVGRPSHPGADIANYVLSKLSQEALDHLHLTTNEVLERLDQHFFS